MARKLFCVLAAALGALACGAPPRPSILLITLDTTRADRLGAYGWKAARTPNLDRLAREGVLFENAVAPTPITLPSHASILTGVAPPAHGLRDNGLFALGGEAELLPEALRRRGWRTAAFVGSFVLHPRFGLDQGFEVYRAPEPGLDARPGFEPQRPANAVVDDFLAWFEGVGPEERFFAWVHFFDPHYPYYPPVEWRTGELHPYDAEIAFTDQELGRLLRGLEERGRADSTLVAVTADHGESVGEHGESSHGVFVYQATLRVPLFFWGAPVSRFAGARVEGFVSLLDLPATLLALAGEPTDALPRAASEPLLRPGQAPPARAAERPIYVESLLPFHSFRWQAVRGLVDDGYKLVESESPELYALEQDPNEQNDLARAEPERLARLRSRLDAVAVRHQSLGWGGARNVSTGEQELLESLGYLASAGGDDPFDPRLPAPRDRIQDIELVSEAGFLLMRAAKKAPLEPGQFVGIGKGVRATGRPQVLKARALLVELRGRNPRDPNVAVSLGTVESLLGHYAAAVPLLEEAVRLRPSDAYLYHHLAHALEAVGRSEAALRVMRRARDLDPGDPRHARWLDRRDPSPPGR